MDPLSSCPPTIIFEDERPPGFDESPFSSSVDVAAQQLLRKIGWTYYTIWQEDIHPLTGVVYRLSWSRGDVIRHSSGGEHHIMGVQQSSTACEMGLALQKFYRQCTSLPLGLGIAGRAIASGHYQWASGNELSQQMSVLSRFNHQPAGPPALLQAHGFQTILCIPWKTNSGVLEIGTTMLVPENHGMLSQILEFTNTFGSQLHNRPRLTPSSNIRRQHYGQQELKQYPTTGQYASNMPTQSRVTRQLSLSGSCPSSSSPSSSPSMEQVSNTMTMLRPSPTHPSFDDSEETLMSSVSSVPAAPMSMVTSFSELDIDPNQTDCSHKSLYGSLVSMPDLSFEFYNVHDRASPAHFDHNRKHLMTQSPTFSCYSSGLNVDVASPPSMPAFLTEYMPQQLVRDQYDEGNQFDYGLHVSQPSPSSTGQNDGNIDDHVKGPCSGAELSPIIPIDMHVSPAPGATSMDCSFNVARSKGKQVVPNVLSSAEIEGKNSKNDSVREIQGQTSMIVQSGHLLHQNISHYETPCHGEDPQKDMPEEKFTMQAFKPWRVTTMSTRKKATRLRSISNNRYNVKQIFRFHLPRIANMMNAEGAAARATHFMLMQSGLVAPTLQQQLLTTVEADYRVHNTTRLANENIDHEAAAAAATQHMFAERNRRRKQGDCIALLRTLVPNITKRCKVSTLEHTIEYVKEMQRLVHDLRQQNQRLEGMGTSDRSQNVITTTRNASCEFCQSSEDDQHAVHPHFALDLSIQLKEVEANAAIANMIEALERKNLQCLNLKTEFNPSSNYLFAKILAQHKMQDGKSYTPTSAEIEDIKQWWTNHIDKT